MGPDLVSLRGKSQWSKASKATAPGHVPLGTLYFGVPSPYMLRPFWCLASAGSSSFIWVGPAPGWGPVCTCSLFLPSGMLSGSLALQVGLNIWYLCLYGHSRAPHPGPGFMFLLPSVVFLIEKHKIRQYTGRCRDKNRGNSNDSSGPQNQSCLIIIVSLLFSFFLIKFFIM